MFHTAEKICVIRRVWVIRILQVVKNIYKQHPPRKWELLFDIVRRSAFSAIAAFFVMWSLSFVLKRSTNDWKSARCSLWAFSMAKTMASASLSVLTYSRNSCSTSQKSPHKLTKPQYSLSIDFLFSENGTKNRPG